MKNQSKKQNLKGFSLLEVMIVIFILSVALVAFIQTIVKSLDHSFESRDTIIASSLAQEGVELVKNVRDNNWAKNDPLGAFSGLNNGSRLIDYVNTPTFGSTPTLRKLKVNGSGYYNHSAGSPTKFEREITITQNGLGDAETRNILSMVVWEGASFQPTNNCSVKNKCVYAQITLTQWASD